VTWTAQTLQNREAAETVAPGRCSKFTMLLQS